MNKAILQAIVDMIIKTGIPRILHNNTHPLQVTHSIENAYIFRPCLSNIPTDIKYHQCSNLKKALFSVVLNDEKLIIKNRNNLENPFAKYIFEAKQTQTR